MVPQRSTSKELARDRLHSDEVHVQAERDLGFDRGHRLMSTLHQSKSHYVLIYGVTADVGIGTNGTRRHMLQSSTRAGRRDVMSTRVVVGLSILTSRPRRSRALPHLERHQRWKRRLGINLYQSRRQGEDLNVGGYRSVVSCRCWSSVMEATPAANGLDLVGELREGSLSLSETISAF